MAEMRTKLALFMGYFSSSAVVFLTNPYRLEDPASRVGTSLGWPLNVPYLALTYYLGHSLPAHFIGSTILPVAIFSLIILIAVGWWFYSLPPVTPIDEIIKRHADWTINNASNNSAVARAIVLPQTPDEEPEPQPSRLNFKVQPRQSEDRCAICRRMVVQDQDPVNCPACDSPFHYAHFAEWVKVKGFCPVCRTRIIAISE
ncbi:MAG: RING finger protein [Candidatus Hodarchaeota archaeon]